MLQTCNSQEAATGNGRELKRRLENRHIQLIAISGAIGTGLFMGSGKMIALSGSSILLVYAIIGFFVFASCGQWARCFSPTLSWARSQS